MKLADIINSIDSLNKLAEKDLPIAVSYRLARVMTSIEKDINSYFNYKNELIIKYGEQTDAKNYKIKEEYLQTYTTELTNLLDTEVDLYFTKITLPENVCVSANALINLSWLLNTEEVI